MRSRLRSARPFVIEESRRARCRPEEVMEKVLVPSEWPKWQPEIVAMKGPDSLEEGDVSWGEAKMLGFHVEGRSDAVEVGPRSFQEEVMVGVRLDIRFELRPEGDRVLITRRLKADLPGGVLGAVLSFFLKRRLKLMQREVLDALVAQAEGRSAS